MDVARFAADVYPTAGPHGLDRFIYSPLIAVYRTAAKAGLCELPHFQRPARPKRKAVSFAKDDTLAALLPHCGERLAAALLFVSFTGARASECCRLEEADVDWERHEALLRHTKNGEPRVVVLPGLVYEALARLKGRHGPLFGFKQRHSLNQAIARAAGARCCPQCPRTRFGATPSQRGC